MADPDRDEAALLGDAPSLPQQTRALGKTLKVIATDNGGGTPSAAAQAAFRSWLAEAGPTSREPRLFADVAANYEAAHNSNKDLWDLFGLLEGYLEPNDEEPDDPAPRTFIGLPLVGESDRRSASE